MVRWMFVGFVGAAAIGCAKSATPDTAAAAAEEAVPEVAMSEREATIRSTFQAYREALLSADGPTTAALVDEKTLGWFEELVGQAVDLDRAGFEKLGLIDALMVLKMRQELTRSELEALKGNAYAQLADNPDFVDPNVASMVTELHTVTFTGEDVAWGSFKLAPDQPAFFFVREADGWKLDAWSIMDNAGMFGEKYAMDLSSEAGQAALKAAAASMFDGELDDAVLDTLLSGPRD